MRAAILGGLSALAVFAVVASVASLLVGRLAAHLADARNPDAARMGGRLFVLRLLPGLAGLAVAAGLVLPAFLVFEPAGISERPGWTVVLLGLAGALAVLLGLRRAIADWRATRRLRRAWTRDGRRLDLPAAPAPAYAIRHSFPVVSLVGILRPRLFLAEQVIERLSPEELAAVLAHEAGHLSAHDNLKRLALRLCPVLPWPGAFRRLEERWEQASEEAADGRAGGALDLAAALIKTARLAPAGSRVDLPAVAFHRGGTLARRVRLLTQGHEAVPAASRGRGWLGVLVLTTVLVLAWSPAVLSLVHRVVEGIVHLP